MWTQFGVPSRLPGLHGPDVTVWGACYLLLPPGSIYYHAFRGDPRTFEYSCQPALIAYLYIFVSYLKVIA